MMKFQHLQPFRFLNLSQLQRLTSHRLRQNQNRRHKMTNRRQNLALVKCLVYHLPPLLGCQKLRLRRRLNLRLPLYYR